MRKALVIGCLVFLKSFLCFSQERKSKFSLEGSVDIDTGKVSFGLVGDSTYYPINMRSLRANIINGEFYINGFIEQPLAYQISTNDGVLTGVFLVDRGRQKITIQSQINKSVPKVDNLIMGSDYVRYSKSLKS